MEKLIELLNEYGRQREGVYWTDYQADMDFTNREKTLFCSKYRGWIRWLVENDKIDFEGMSGHGKIISYLTDEKDYKWNDIKEGVVLMLLSISDTPIEDLISYLK